MRDRTRSYTTDLPRIGLPFLAHMRSRLADAELGTQLYTQTESGTLYTFRQADSYAMTINGVTRRFALQLRRPDMACGNGTFAPTV